MLTLLLACTGAKDSATVVDADPAPALQISPVEIDFGQVMVNDTVAHTETVTLTNVGGGPLEIYSVSLEDPNKPFTISALGSVLVPPGQSTTFTVTYEPLTASADEVDLIVQSNDPDEFGAVHLRGLGLAPFLWLDPETHDFGAVDVGCEATAPLKIRNVGNADLVVSSLSYVSDSDELSVDTLEAINGPLPWTIAPGGEVEVDAIYRPTDDREDEGYLQISSDDPVQGTAQAHQLGVGVAYGEHLDVYEQPTTAPTDILFIIDNSSSMSDEQANLTSNLTSFIQDLIGRDGDYRLAVITTDDPTFRGDVLTPTSDDLASEFIAQATPGTGGSEDELPSEMAYQSTQGGADAGPGGGFLRDDALLAMIFVSDEPDSSPNTWADYLAHFQGLKADPGDVVIHAISGDYPSGCGGASATNNVYEMSVASGGLYLSICATDWSSRLATVAGNPSQHLSSFDLSRRPVPSTIVVRVDGAIAVGWVYNAIDNAVEFEASAIPEGGSTIEIAYLIQGECDG